MVTDTFTFTQYAGNLNCGGTGVVKTVTLDECEQDYPPSIYSIGIDFECCKNPNEASCTTGIGSTSVTGTKIYADGVLCDDEESPTPAVPTPIAPTLTPLTSSASDIVGMKNAFIYLQVLVSVVVFPLI